MRIGLLAVLTELGTLAASVASRIDDTRMAVGGEAMQEAIQVWSLTREPPNLTRQAHRLIVKPGSFMW